MRRPFVDVLDAVVHEEDLPAARELALDALVDERVVVLPTNVRIASRSAGGVAMIEISRSPIMRHVQGARDGRRGQREHVDLRAQLLELLLVRDAEALLLVDDHEAELAEAHVGGQQPMRADDDVDLAVGDASYDLGLLGFCDLKRDSDATRTGQSRSRSAKVTACCSTRTVVGARTATCLPPSTRLQGGAQRDLGLAVADVAAHQAIHGPRLLMSASTSSIAFCWSSVSSKGKVASNSLEERLRPGFSGNAWPGSACALRVELEQLLGQLPDLARDLAARLLPGERRPGDRAWAVTPSAPT